MSRTLAYDPRYALNAICPYYTMFPLEYPFRILKKYRTENPIVLDPFCGRGTTIFAARNLGMASWGIDTSPIAVAIAKAKLANTTLKRATNLIDRLLEVDPEHIPDTQFFRKAFSKSTLKEVCALREGLNSIRSDSDTSVLVRAAALGCLHGPLSKSLPDAGYFSNQMPRTFATKPDYSVSFWKDKSLKAPRVSVKRVLLRKLERIINQPIEKCGALKQIICGDSATYKTFAKIPRGVSVVVTSPPYYGMRSYTQDQWLRMWFLGGPDDIDYIWESQLSHKSHDEFSISLASVWSNIRRSATDDIHMHVRFGSVPSIKSDAKKLIHSSLEESKNWRVVSARTARSAHAGKRQADQMALGSNASEEYDFHIVRSN